MVFIKTALTQPLSALASDAASLQQPSDLQAATQSLSNSSLRSSRSSQAIAPREIVFIDRGLTDYQTLAAGVRSGSEVVFLDARQDGIQQISNILAQRQGISAVHVLSHGRSGALQLGDAELSNLTIDQYANTLKTWSNALTDDADILLYGCNLASGDVGNWFVNRFHELTGADIAASNDLTGNAALGGDWILEVNTGAIAANLGFQQIAISQYQATFAIIDAADYNALRSGVNQFLTAAQTAMDALVWSNELPLVGDQLASTTQLFQGVFNNIQTAWTTLDAIANADGDSNGVPDGVESSVIRTQLATQLSPWLSAAGITVDETATNLQFTLNLNRAINSAVGFDLGLDAIDLSIAGNVNAGLNYQLPLTFGVNLTSSEFYVDTSATNELNIGVAITTPGLNAAGRLGFLQLNVQDSSIDATDFSGDFRIDVRDPNSDGRLTAGELASISSAQLLTPRLEAAANVNLVLTASFGDSAVFPSLQTDFNLDWAFSPTDPNLTGGLPSAAFNNVRLDLGSFFSGFVSPIAAEVKKVLDPIQPVLDVLNARMPVLSDIEFLRDRYDAPANGGNGDGKVSLVEFIGRESNNTAATRFINSVTQFKQFIDAIPTGVGSVYIPLGNFRLNESPGTDLRSLANLNSLGITNFDDLSTTLPGVDAATRNLVQTFRNQVGNSSLGGGLAFPILQNPTTAFGLLLGRDVSLFTYDLPTLGVEFNVSQFFPILGPLGVRLAGEFEARADFAFGYDTFGMRQFSTAITDSDPATTPDPSMLFNGFFVSDTDRPDGTFGTDVPEIRLRASLTASGELNVVVAAAGVGGGIFANVNFDLRNPSNPTNDPTRDGKVRLSELADQVSSRGPLGIFSTSGKLEAGLDAYVRVGVDLPFVGFVGWEESFDIARVTLLDFDLDASDLAPNPTLAQFDSTLGGAGTLRLNIGRFAGDRLVGNITDGDETFKVTRSDDGTQILVTAFGFTQAFNASDVSRIYAEGGSGNDVIEIAETVTVPAELWGDFRDPARTEFGNDQLFAGSAAARLFGGGGNDQLTARAGDSLLNGGAGNDALFGGTGNDTLEGEAGSDRLYGNLGNDTLNGGSESDYLDAGDGNDTVNGGTGDDRIKGGAGNDILNGNDGNDILEAGTGDDVADGGAGNDYILDEGTIVVGSTGGPSAPVPPGGPVVQNVIISPTAGVTVQVQLGVGGGNDRFFGGTGNDVMFGQAGNDILIGQAGDDWIDGGSDRDTIAGDLASVDGAGNLTLIAGTGGNDLLFGGTGNDFLYGQGGNDVIFGDSGQITSPVAGTEEIASTDPSNGAADFIQGNDGDDVIIAGAGNDTEVTGNAGNDILLGDNGRVTRVNGAVTRVETTNPEVGGNDRLSGNAGADIIIGGSGNDTLTNEATDPDILIGDNAVVVRQAGSTEITSTAPTFNPAIGGSDIITGSNLRDVIIGGSGGNDRAGVSGDSITGNGGDDLIFGDNAFIRRNDTTNEITAEVRFADIGGDDTIAGNAGSDNIYGGGGNDAIVGGSFTAGVADGTDYIRGGAGNDLIAGDNATIDRATQTITNLDAIGAADFLFGDDGTVTVVAGAVTAAESVAAIGDGDDRIRGHVGNDYIFGGGANDRVFGDSGDDILWGDHGRITFVGGQPSLIESTAPGTGGSDVIEDTDGTTIALGGTGALDTITTGAGADLIIGDNGRITLLNGVAQRIETTFASEGGNDVINSGNASDVVLAGRGDDAINAGLDNAADILLGDNGRVTLAGAGNHDIESTDPLIGGSDTIIGNGGDDIIIGGSGNDNATGGGLIGGAGNDIVIGDNAIVTRNTANVVLRIATAFAEQGGDDRIFGDADADILIGGTGNDTIAGGDDESADSLLGDNGVVVLADGSAQANDIYSTDPTFGGRDSITGGGGADIIVGGSGGLDVSGSLGDTLRGNAGDDIVLGDNGYITRNASNQVERIETAFFNALTNSKQYTPLGGDDVIEGNEGASILFGGAGNDTITAGLEADLVVGDDGEATFTAATGELLRLQTRNPGVGGNDTIVAGNSSDIVLGGTGDDTIDGGLDNAADILLGDNGVIVRNDGTPEANDIFSTDPEFGGRDTIRGNGGDDIILGGSGDDNRDAGGLIGGTGNDIILGDNGYVRRNALDGVQEIETRFPTVGGDDRIEGNFGVDVVLAGFGNDTVFGNQHTDYLVGDNGRILYNQDADLSTIDLVTTTDAAAGGNDTINGGVGDDFVLGGTGDDAIGGQTENDVLLGDNGQFQFVAGRLTRIATSDPTIGGQDVIDGSAGDDIVLGGANDDTITGFTGRDILLGDNGFLDYVVDSDPTTIDLIQTTQPAIGGADTINGDAGDDIAIGGAGNDIIRGNQGNDQLLGDNGRVTLTGGQVRLLETIDPEFGGNDRIAGNEDDDVIAGGTGYDVIAGGTGNDRILGDNGRFDYAFAGDARVGADANLTTLDVFTTTDPTLGGRDTISGGFGADILLGGTAGDTIYGDEGNLPTPNASVNTDDLILGDHGIVYRALPVGQNYFSIDTGATDGGGNDLIYGNQGDDAILGQQGNDRLFGEAGEDDLTGGHNVVGGADGDDTINGGANADVVLGDNGTITRRFLGVNALGFNQWRRYPAPFADVIRDVVRFDDLDRIGGNDTISGGAGDDILHGQRGNDTMFGDAGDDEMYGELGNDTMSGGAGQDAMLGDVGIITRAYNPDGTPRRNRNGSWHRDFILTDVGSLTQTVPLTATDLPNADLLLLTGTYTQSGAKQTIAGVWQTEFQAVTLFADGNDVMQGDAGEDAVFGQRGNDEVRGGDGDDYLEGNAGDDQIFGEAGNDLAIGDDSHDLANFQRELPTVQRGVHLIATHPGSAIAIAPLGSILLSEATVVPKLNYGLLPTLTLTAPLSPNTAAPPIVRELTTTNQTRLRPLLTLIPDLANHLPLLSGNDTIDGGAGQDLVVGDDYISFMPLRTGNAGVDNQIDTLTRALYQLVDNLHDREIAIAARTGDSRTLRLGNDTINGGANADTVLGDNGLFYGPLQVQAPSQIAALQTRLADLSQVVSQVDRLVNRVMQPFSGGVSRRTHTLEQANDVINGGNGDDKLYGDDQMTIAPRLNTLSYARGSFWNYAFAGAERSARSNIRDFDVLLGNDTMSGGTGNDTMTGDYSTVIMPLVTIAKPSSQRGRQQLETSLTSLINDVKAFVRDLHNDRHGIDHTQRDYSSRYAAGNDAMAGDLGNDLLLGDNATLLLPVINGAVDLSLLLKRGNLDYSDSSHNFYHSQPHQHSTIYRKPFHPFRLAQDTMQGGAGDDILFGLEANDSLSGGAGNDFLFGGEEDDRQLDGGSGRNVIRTMNPSPTDERTLAKPIRDRLTHPFAPVTQQYLADLLNAPSPTLSGNIYLNFPG